MSYKNILLIMNLSTLVLQSQTPAQDTSITTFEQFLALQGQSCIQTLTEETTITTFEQLAEALRANRTKLCNGCTGYTLSIKIWRGDQYDEQAWTQVKNYFHQLEDADMLEDYPYDAQTIALVGEPFKTILASYNEDNGISDDFDFEYGDDDDNEESDSTALENLDKDDENESDLTENLRSFRLFIEVEQDIIIDDSASPVKEDGSYGDDYKMPIITRSYDAKVWQNISTSFFDFTEKFTSKANPRDLLSHCCPQLATAIAQTKAPSGIHFSIDVTMTDDTNTISLGYNLDKPFEEKIDPQPLD